MPFRPANPYNALEQVGVWITLQEEYDFKLAASNFLAPHNDHGGLKFGSIATVYANNKAKEEDKPKAIKLLSPDKENAVWCLYLTKSKIGFFCYDYRKWKFFKDTILFLTSRIYIAEKSILEYGVNSVLLGFLDKFFVVGDSVSFNINELFESNGKHISTDIIENDSSFAYYSTYFSSDVDNFKNAILRRTINIETHESRENKEIFFSIDNAHELIVSKMHKSEEAIFSNEELQNALNLLKKRHVEFLSSTLTKAALEMIGLKE